MNQNDINKLRNNQKILEFVVHMVQSPDLLKLVLTQVDLGNFA